MHGLKLFLKKERLSPLLFDILSESKSNNEKKLLLLLDNKGTNSCIKIPDAKNNRTFGLLNTDDDYPNGRAEYQMQKCRILTIYNNNNNNNNRYYDSENNADNNSNNNNHDSSLHDFYNSNTLIGSKLYTTTEYNTNDNNNQKSLSNIHDIAISYKNQNQKTTMVLICTVTTTTLKLIQKTAMITIRIPM